MSNRKRPKWEKIIRKTKHCHRCSGRLFSRKEYFFVCRNCGAVHQVTT